MSVWMVSILNHKQKQRPLGTPVLQQMPSLALFVWVSSCGEPAVLLRKGEGQCHRSHWSADVLDSATEAISGGGEWYGVQRACLAQDRDMGRHII